MASLTKASRVSVDRTGFEALEQGAQHKPDLVVLT